MSTLIPKTLSKGYRKRVESIAFDPELKGEIIEIMENDEFYCKYSFSQMISKAAEDFVKVYKAKKNNLPNLTK